MTERKVKQVSVAAAKQALETLQYLEEFMRNAREGYASQRRMIDTTAVAKTFDQLWRYTVQRMREFENSIPTEAHTVRTEPRTKPKRPAKKGPPIAATPTESKGTPAETRGSGWSQ